MSTELAGASELHEKGAFELKQCFAGVKYNGKSKWDPPTERLDTGLWDMSTMEPDKKGEMTLTFNFALDPHSYKAEMSKINKMLTVSQLIDFSWSSYGARTCNRDAWSNHHPITPPSPIPPSD